MTLVFSWLHFFDQTLLSHSVLFSITWTSVTGGLWWTEGSCSGESSLGGLPINVNHTTSTRMYLRSLGNLCSRLAYINFFTPFRAAYNEGWLTIE